jgi:hypothetical protein
MRKQFLLAGAFLGVCFSTNALFADTGNLVLNGSFENGGTAQAGGQELPTNWVETGSGAPQHYVVADAHTPAGNVVDGSNYLQEGNFGQLQQYLAYTPQTGDIIHLSGYGRDFGGAGSYQISLWLDPVGTSDANMNTGVRPIELDGTSAQQTMTLFSGDYTVTPSDAGKMVGVYLATGPGYSGYDAISVTVTPAPEPASLGLLSAGAALLVRRRRGRIA